jgi:hypothetical protein
MTDPQYVRKVFEEAVRCANEKVNEVQAFVGKKNEEFTQFARISETSQKDTSHYFSKLTKQLEKLKTTFLQDIREHLQQSEQDHEGRLLKLQEQVRNLLDLKEKAQRVATTNPSANNASGDTSLIYQIHSCVFHLQTDMEQLDEYTSSRMPLKFVGLLDLEDKPKSEIGKLEYLPDGSGAEILPIERPKIKLGQLFSLTFCLANRHCPAAEQFLDFTVTKDEDVQTSPAVLSNTSSINLTPSKIRVECFLRDCKDGSYQLSFPITAIVSHYVAIRYMGQHIRNSPYTISFKIGTSNSNPAAAMSNPSGLTHQPWSNQAGSHGKPHPAGNTNVFGASSNIVNDSVSSPPNRYGEYNPGASTPHHQGGAGGGAIQNNQTGCSIFQTQQHQQQQQQTHHHHLIHSQQNMESNYSTSRYSMMKHRKSAPQQPDELFDSDERV